MNFPAIQLTVAGMKETILVALSEQTLLMDKILQESVAKFCTEENIARIIDDIAQKELRRLVESTTVSFFQYGKGRKVVQEAILKKLQDSMLIGEDQDETS